MVFSQNAFQTNAPTYENVRQVYKDLHQPFLKDGMIANRKEEMFIMIINLLRLNPSIFNTQLKTIRYRCEKRMNPRNVAFTAFDVDRVTLFLNS